MNKITIFFIIATVLIVSVTGTILGFKYFSGNNEEPEKPIYVVETDENTQPTTTETPTETEVPEEEEEIVEEQPKNEQPPPSVPDPFAMFESTTEPEPENPPVTAGIDESIITKAGFENTLLETFDFNGIVFNDFNMAEYNDDDHILYILTSGEENSAIITELFFPSLEISNEVYASLKAKMTQSGDFEINETNQYGDNSYFANHTTDKNSVFLVVKIKERLYTFHYPAKNHNKIKNLINLL